MYFLSQIVPWSGSARVTTPLRKDGARISLYGDVTATVKFNGTPATRRFRSTAPIDVAGKLEIGICESVVDNSGINALFLSEHLGWEIEAWVTHAKKMSMTDPRTTYDLIAKYESMGNSEIGLLYNLIRQYYLLSIDGKIDNPNKDYYNDGHVAVDYATAFGLEETDGKWSLQPEMGGEMSSEVGDKSVISWPGMTQDQASIYACALGKLTGVPGIPLAASSEALADNVEFGVFPDTISTAGVWDNKSKVKAAIREIVVRGRLYNQFDTALNMVAQTASHFVAPVAEAVPLCASLHKVELPRFSSFRFALRHMLSGESGGERPSANACFRSWLSSPDSFWVYGSIMRSAAEFRGSVTFGTDFDTTGELDRYAESMDVSGGVGKWLNYAASALGIKIYAQPAIPLGASLANYDAAIAMRVVGTLSDYNVVEDVGVGATRRVRIAIFDDERRQGMHSRLLFALGLLPESKAGCVETKAKFEVRRSRRDSSVCAVPGQFVGPYLTMCRAHGWDATVKVAADRHIRSWSDNESRMNWSSRELQDYGGTLYDVNELRWRGEPLNKQRINPAMPGTYEYDMSITGVGTLYDYDCPIFTGARPANIAIVPKGAKVEVKTMGTDLALAPPTFQATEQDFGEVQALSGQIAPGQVIEEVQVPPAIEEEALGLPEA